MELKTEITLCKRKKHISNAIELEAIIYKCCVIIVIIILFSFFLFFLLHSLSERVYRKQVTCGPQFQ